MSISSGEDEFIKHIKPVRIQKLAITGLFPENDFTSPDPSKKGTCRKAERAEWLHEDRICLP
jgi:hypothetical protein